jgi:putative spermidine/putrescine transport system ATP-binding protein
MADGGASIGRDVESAITGLSVGVEQVSHDFAGHRALDGVSMEVAPGEIMALLGPSGCGKTTLLRVIAGFLRQSRGAVFVGGVRMDRLPAGRRNVGIVFQNYALFPHLTAAENVGYGLAARGAPRSEVRRRAAEFLDVVQMGHLADRRPANLSGGQQQRVALARALCVEPGVLLLDEPFAALDKNLRLDMQIEIKRLQRRFGLTAILVTHDQEEAMSMADKVAVMNGGRIEQLGAPSAVYDAPRSLFVNSFIGSSNLLNATVGEDGLARLDVGGAWPAPPDAPRGRVVVSARPEDLTLDGEAAPDRFPARLRLSLPLGATTVLDLQAAGGVTIKIVRLRSQGLGADDAVFCGLRPGARLSVFPAPD